MVFVACGNQEGDFFIEVDSHADTGFSHGAGFGAVYHTVHLFRDGGDIPFEAVTHIGVEQGNEFGVSEIHGDIQVDRYERGVSPEIESGTQAQLEVWVELVSQQLVDGDVKVPVLYGLLLQLDLPDTSRITNRGHVDEFSGRCGATVLGLSGCRDEHGGEQYDKCFFHNVFDWLILTGL